MYHISNINKKGAAPKAAPLWSATSPSSARSAD
jgi:hypothetical protein